MKNLNNNYGLYREIERLLLCEPHGKDRSIFGAGNVKNPNLNTEGFSGVLDHAQELVCNSRHVKFYVPGLDWPLELSKGVNWARSICQLLDWCPRRVLVMREYEKRPGTGLFLKLGYDSGVRGFNQMKAEIDTAVRKLSSKAVGSEIASQEEYRWIMWNKLQAGQFNNANKIVWSLPFAFESVVT